MKTSEVLELVAERMGKPVDEVRELGESTIKVFWKTLGNEDGFSITGFGTFGTQKRDSRKFYSPYHKKYLMAPEKQVVFFRPSQLLKLKVKDKKFE